MTFSTTSSSVSSMPPVDLTVTGVGGRGASDSAAWDATGPIRSETTSFGTVFAAGKHHSNEEDMGGEADNMDMVSGHLPSHTLSSAA